MARVNRRLFLLGGAAAAGAVALPAWARSASYAAAPAIPYPFQLGVASGDPYPDSVVLWTRLAPAPLNSDGYGGMPDASYDVTWQLAADENFTTVVASGVYTTSRSLGYSVHVEPGGLQPGAHYFYRFLCQGYTSAVGRTRTAPAVGSVPAQLSICFASCQHFESGWYHAWRGVTADNPDLVLFLGDYMYENPTAIRVRQYTLTTEVSTLAAYRQRYAQHRTDPNLKAAHAAAPWIVVPDDHEVENNYNGSSPSATRKAAAYQAYWENMPLRATAKPSGSSFPVYRQFLWGALARFHMLDTRQYRSVQAAAGDCTTMRSTSRTITGATQEQWLLDAFGQHPATWDLIGQQVFFAQRDADGVRGSGSLGCDNSTDGWDGYAASRDRIANGWVSRGLPNPVVLTGDVHRHYAADLRLDYYDHSAPIIGSELVTTSVTSGGNTDNDPPSSTWWANNPHVKYYQNKRGYVRATITPQALTADFRIVSDPTVSDPAQVTISTNASFAVAAGTRGLHSA